MSVMSVMSAMSNRGPTTARRLPRALPVDGRASRPAVIAGRARHQILTCAGVRAGDFSCTGRRGMTDDPNASWRSVVARPIERDAFHPLSSVVALEIAAASMSGTLRPVNTDHYLALKIGRTQETVLSSLAAADS